MSRLQSRRLGRRPYVPPCVPVPRGLLNDIEPFPLYATDLLTCLRRLGRTHGVSWHNLALGVGVHTLEALCEHGIVTRTSVGKSAWATLNVEKYVIWETAVALVLNDDG